MIFITNGSDSIPGSVSKQGQNTMPKQSVNNRGSGESEQTSTSQQDNGKPVSNTVPMESASTEKGGGGLSIVVIDDHEIVSLGVEHAFANADVPAEFFYARSTQDVPVYLGDRAVVILDLRLHDGSTPTESLAFLELRNLPAVVYTSADDPVLVREAIRAGAMAIVRKSAPAQELIQNVLAAADGQPSAGLDWAAALDVDRDFVGKLTETERAILEKYAAGEAAESIAHELAFSIHTVNKTVARVRDKYRQEGRKVESRVDLFRRAAEDGLISYFEPK